MLRLVRELFCSRLFPGGRWLLLAEVAAPPTLRSIRPLTALGFDADACISVPNAVLDYAERGWLILLEIAEQNRVIDSDHRHNLLSSFASVKGRELVLITAFADMGEFARHLAAIAWGTSAWIADAPDHLVVFDGRRLGGPEPALHVHAKRNL